MAKEFTDNGLGVHAWEDVRGDRKSVTGHDNQKFRQLLRHLIQTNVVRCAEASMKHFTAIHSIICSTKGAE